LDIPLANLSTNPNDYKLKGLPYLIPVATYKTLKGTYLLNKMKRSMCDKNVVDAHD